MKLLKALFSRPTSQPDVPSPLDVEDGVGLTPGARARLVDLGHSAYTIRQIDADVRAANGAWS